MKLERTQEYVTVAATTIVGMIVAVACGTFTGRGQTGALFLIVACCLFGALCLWLKHRVWILIPVSWTLTGQIRELPIPFAVRDIMVGAVFAISLAFIALKIIRGKPSYQLVDLVLGGILIYLLTVFLRNPAGVDALNSQRIGGKPYFNVFMAGLAYWVLTRVSVTAGESRIFPVLVGMGGLINSALQAITVNFPALAPWMSRFYSGVAVEAYMTEGYVPEQLRRTYLAGGIIPLLGLFSYFRPIRTLNPFVWWLFIPAILCLLGVLLSGFRSLLVAAVVYFCIASYVRSGWRDIIRCAMIGLPLLVCLIMGQGRLFDLPRPMQRSLSFLPGAWSPSVVADAQHSTQWRLYMWKIVLKEDKYITNKWLGDGFGFSRREYAIMQRMSYNNPGAEGDQESVMITGGVHSGPISTMRVIGIVGLLAYIFFLVLFARYAWRLIRRAQNTPFFPMALFLAIPVVWEPFGFLFIFGAFEISLPNSILTLGLLNMLNNSLTRAELPSGSGPIAPARPALHQPPARRSLREGQLISQRSGNGPVWQPKR